MKKLFLSVALLAVAPAFVFAAEEVMPAAAIEAAKPAAAAIEAAKPATSDVKSSYSAWALKSANNLAACVRGLIEKNPLMAVATVMAFTIAAAEAVHYFATSEDEEAQF